MKNIFIYIGSPRGNNSNTVHFAEEVLKKVASKSDENVKYEIFTPKNVNIKNCLGCSNCFKKASCDLDKDDDMKMLKEKMIKADFIIFGSPVYAHNITSDMKQFIDRISYWFHIMRLAGKPGVILTTTSSNGSDFVHNYLYKIMTFLGIKVVGRFNAFVDFPRQLDEKNFMENNVSEYANVILDYISKNKKVETDDMLEAVYQSLRSSMMLREGSNNAQYLYWKTSNMLEFENFGDVIKH